MIESLSESTLTVHRSRREYLDALLARGIITSTGVPGVYGKSSEFERVLSGFDRFITESGLDQGAETYRFPPVISRSDLERSEYLKSFPHLVGTIDSFQGTERDHLELLRMVESRADWSGKFEHTDLALTPAACYPVYPMATGVLPRDGRLFDVQSYCFRHEPSEDPARMQVFRQHEYVRIGTPEHVRHFRDLWLDRSHAMLKRVGLDAQVVVANDPFFGRGGAMLAASQMEQALKFELVVPIASADHLTAAVSCNYHQDHFGSAFDISTADGATAHTACVGFGLERITLALFKAHGLDETRWPPSVQTTLGL
ncbi:MAG TPA: amino acid--[acyl-carrier-protein] ligase [Gemmatimonadaceae bacterium]|jgi:seryl-tRNA synthetase